MYFINTSNGMDRPCFVPYFKVLKGVFQRVSLMNTLTMKQIIMRINLVAILITLSLTQATASSFGQSVTLHKRGASLNEVLKMIKKQTNYTFLYNSELLKDAKMVSVDLDKATLEEALKASLANQSLTFKIIENTILLKKKEDGLFDKVANYLSAIDLSGKILDEDGKPLPGATIRVKNTTRTVLTNERGEFELKGIDDKAILIISFLGYTTKEVQASKANPLIISLDVNPAELGEVAVVSTGYQKIPAARAAGSYVVVSDKAMAGKLQTNIVERLEGMVAGLTSFKSGLNTKPNIQIRGVSSLTATSATPLYVVDGAPFFGDIQALNPSDVESVTVLKDASAASIYGALSSNGVIVITTRSGKAGKLNINYNATAKFVGLPDRAYSNKMSSAEMVDFQREMFNYRSGAYASIDPRKAMVETYRLFYDARQGVITEAELQKKLDVLRNSDRYDQVVNEFLRKTSLTQQHNLSFSGGNEFYKYSLSGNYLGNAPYERAQTNNRVGFNLKNSFNFTKWATLNIGVLGSNTRNDYDNGSATNNVSPGMSILDAGKASFYMLRNSDGSLATNWLNSKSQFEIDRLKSLGLQDENYNPITDLNTSHLTNTSKYLNLNFSANLKIMDGLNLDLLYQNERTELYNKQYYNKDAYKVKTMINDATIKDAKQTKMIPVGGQMNEQRGDMNTYTLRTQLNYNKEFNSKHRVDAIFGAEKRKLLGSSTNIYKYGYDDYSLNYKPIDEQALSLSIPNTQALFDQFNFPKGDSRAERGFVSTDDRYVSLYGNGSYTYNNRITLSGSIRMDQANLFGTDPKYQYKPFWSTGLLYVVAENKRNWLDRLAVRATYGINGAVPKSAGPYLITQSSGNNGLTGETQDGVVSPPNSGLKWERTRVTNFGLDFSVLSRRFYGSIDIYNKATSDLLGDLKSDPTLGWNSITVNYGTMNNRGIDLTLNSNNLNTTDFNWITTLNFNYNKNKLTRLDYSSNTVFSYINGFQNRQGVPMGSLYSVRYGGLDNKGVPKALTADGTEVYSTDKLSAKDLVYNGTTIPPYSASLQNTLSYKGFDLFFMFIYYGGNVMRDVTAPYLTKLAELNYTNNMERSALVYWKKPGDELIPGMAPAFNSAVGGAITNIWEFSDQNIQKADYIKLRDITLSYNFTGNWLKKNYIQRMKLSLQVQNAWRWAANKNKLDTEVWNGTSTTYSATMVPSTISNSTRGLLYPASYTVGLAVNF
ncbi:MAG: SusC/RagA family TonB-linked outer membrane protein [Candidatus Pedobacter colombiensis]|uniref:SusC/RagA family TonB-linked outer membrane protein n=1 Tax=Candidatus Pedobacter colombiensis TaxID=3121371 RepID=A0AAJ5W9P9_9SPHI|nr:SusC/RagA family TonB-linked outer membrane protein [Pedobacter sp.]WEK20571.1 MAG: SusC/RagA family TonB-linked outer membrane protein [Pedobacter sp.]